MKLERAILIAFLGNYLVNNVVAAIAAFVPAGTSGSILTAQYITFIVLAALLVALMTWWYKPTTMMQGLMFGVLGFVVSIAAAFITGVSGVLIQTASFSTLVSVLPNFGPFLWSWSTLVLLGYWVVPALLIGWWMGMSRTARPMSQSVSSNPMSSPSHSM
jgi:hypothetical protein